MITLDLHTYQQRLLDACANVSKWESAMAAHNKAGEHVKRELVAARAELDVLIRNPAAGPEVLR